MNTPTPLEVVEKLRIALETRKNDEFIDQFADDGIFEMPFAMEGQKSKYEGIKEIRERFGSISAMGQILEINKVDAVITEGANPEVIIAEFTAKGKSKKTDLPFNIASSIAHIRIRNGKVVHYKDFPNSLGFMQVAGTLKQFAESLS